jgi:chromate reductase
VQSMRILAVSGSLRKRSANSAALSAAALLTPPGVQVVAFAGLAALPHFNPDLDGESATLPDAVADFRQSVAEADALLICSPEYAHGVPGALKNALDWLVRDPRVVYKPVGVLNVSPRSTHAQASLVETLRTMSLTVVPRASIALPVTGRNLDADGIARDGELGPALRGALRALMGAVADARARRSQLWDSAPKPCYEADSG